MVEPKVEINLSMRDLEEILVMRYGGKPEFRWIEPKIAWGGFVIWDDLVRDDILVTLTYEQ